MIRYGKKSVRRLTMKNFVNRSPQTASVRKIRINGRSTEGAFSFNDRCIIFICSRTETLKISSRMRSCSDPVYMTTCRFDSMKF
jgi:hypothetical protein